MCQLLQGHQFHENIQDQLKLPDIENERKKISECNLDSGTKDDYITTCFISFKSFADLALELKFFDKKNKNSANGRLIILVFVLKWKMYCSFDKYDTSQSPW